MLTNHVQRGWAYCFFKDDVVEVPSEHIPKVCMGESCPFLNGFAQGEGIECLWDDGTDDGLTVDMPMIELQDRGEAVRKELDETGNL